MAEVAPTTITIDRDLLVDSAVDVAVEEEARTNTADVVAADQAEVVEVNEEDVVVVGEEGSGTDRKLKELTTRLIQSGGAYQ